MRYFERTKKYVNNEKKDKTLFGTAYDKLIGYETLLIHN